DLFASPKSSPRRTRKTRNTRSLLERSWSLTVSCQTPGCDCLPPAHLLLGVYCRRSGTRRGNPDLHPCKGHYEASSSRAFSGAPHARVGRPRVRSPTTHGAGPRAAKPTPVGSVVSGLVLERDPLKALFR